MFINVKYLSIKCKIFSVVKEIDAILTSSNFSVTYRRDSAPT